MLIISSLNRRARGSNYSGDRATLNVCPAYQSLSFATYFWNSDTIEHLRQRYANSFAQVFRCSAGSHVMSRGRSRNCKFCPSRLQMRAPLATIRAKFPCFVRCQTEHRCLRLTPYSESLGVGRKYVRGLWSSSTAAKQRVSAMLRSRFPRSISKRTGVD